MAFLIGSLILEILEEIQYNPVIYLLAEIRSISDIKTRNVQFTSHKYFMDSTTKLENPEECHVYTGRTHKFHTGRLGIKSLTFLL